MKSALRNILIVLTAIVLACSSRVLASPDNGPILHLWFNALFDFVQEIVEFENAWVLLAADMGVMVSQYLALFWVLYVLGRLIIRVVRHSANRLRRGEVRP